MIANTSPKSKRGISIPVEALAPYTMTKEVTIKTAIPLIPDLEMPNKKAAKAAR